jgi:hypothetical protein
MAVSTTRFVPETIPGAEAFTLTDVQFDSSYQEGGEPLTPKELGLTSVSYAFCQIRLGSESEEYVSEAWYSPSQQKIHLINCKTGKEVAGTKDMSKVNVRVIAYGSRG